MQASEAEKPRIVILISGTGSNMVAIAEAVKKEEIDADIVGIISNRPNAAGLEKAQAMDLHTDLIDHTLYASRDEFDHALIRMIEDLKPDLVVLAGFMRILTADFTRYYEGRLLNIHPSLLPKYQGLNTHKRALDAGDDIVVLGYFSGVQRDDGERFKLAASHIYSFNAGKVTKFQQFTDEQSMESNTAKLEIA